MSVRRAAVLASQLPPGARVYAEEGVDLAGTDEWYLLREVIFRLELQIWQHADPKKRGDAPERIPTPSQMRDRGDAEAEKARRTAGSRERHIQRFRDRLRRSKT